MSILTKPQGNITLAWVMIQGQDGQVKRMPAVIDVEWDRYLSILTERAGGVIGVSTTELVESSFEDAGISENLALFYANEQGQNQRPAFDAGQFAQQDFLGVNQADNMAEVRARIDVLESEIAALKQGTLI